MSKEDVEKIVEITLYKLNNLKAENNELVVQYVELAREEEKLEQALKEIEEYINDTDMIKIGYSFRIDDMRFFENIEKIINKAKGDENESN